MLVPVQPCSSPALLLVTRVMVTGLPLTKTCIESACSLDRLAWSKRTVYTVSESCCVSIFCRIALPLSEPTISAYVLPVTESCCNSTALGRSVNPTPPCGCPPFWSETQPNFAASKPGHFTHLPVESNVAGFCPAFWMYSPLAVPTLVNLPQPRSSAYPPRPTGLIVSQPPSSR